MKRVSINKSVTSKLLNDSVEATTKDNPVSIKTDGAKDLSKEAKVAALEEKMKPFRVNLSGYKFNRDEANDYD